MSLTGKFVRSLLKRFGIPEHAQAFWDANGQISQPSEVSIPGELIPMGARINLRGFMNINAFQPNLDWVWPYWIERQFRPESRSFVPRAMYWIALNVTHRNWTMIGNLDSEYEAVVDPRGLLTPQFESWSLDVWLKVGDELVAPSRLDAVEQYLEDDLPVVVTRWRHDNWLVETKAYAGKVGEQEQVINSVRVCNDGVEEADCELGLAIRPYNPEGVSLVKQLCYQPERRTWLINGVPSLYLGAQPALVITGNHREGDVSLRFHSAEAPCREIACPAGLASGLSMYCLRLKPGESFMADAHMPLKAGEPIVLTDQPDAGHAYGQMQAAWSSKLKQGLELEFPDARLTSSFNANKAYMLLFHDGNYITPGPMTYHHFWFRDAAYLLNALDKLGYHREVEQVLDTYPGRQRRDGFYISQNGEWDANGQAIWAIMEHYRLTGNTEIVHKHYSGISKGANWIEQKRTSRKCDTSAPHHGLLPPGFSAEHFGPNDYFYWDDFWGIAGLREAALAAGLLGRADDAARFKSWERTFGDAVQASLRSVEARLGEAVMPVSPYRRLDSAAIGSISALYPLRLMGANDRLIANTLKALKQKCFIGDAFLQSMLHSGLNCYLSMHYAQCLLMRRDNGYWHQVNWFLEHATPTFTWPEGINNQTMGGCMGDGHHGWAAADWVLILRNSLLVEDGDVLVLTPALPGEWVQPGKHLAARKAPTYFGTVDMEVAFSDGAAELLLTSTWRKAPAAIHWYLPVPIKGALIDGQEVGGNGSYVELPPQAQRVSIRF